MATNARCATAGRTGEAGAIRSSDRDVAFQRTAGKLASQVMGRASRDGGVVSRRP
jgi:hypothetical protein